MTKEEYLKEMSEILEQRQSLLDRQTKVETAYKWANAEFKRGDKVTVIRSGSGKQDHGIVHSNKVDKGGEISPLIYKMKKDGSPHTHQVYVWRGDKIIPYQP